jgi:hypothetical protein
LGHPSERGCTVKATVRAEWRRFDKAWRDALDANERYSDGSRWEHFLLLEEEAYTALCDFVEENDLNYTQFDPRGPRDSA